MQLPVQRNAASVQQNVVPVGASGRSEALRYPQRCAPLPVGGLELYRVKVFTLACPFNCAVGPHLAAPRRHPKLRQAKSRKIVATPEGTYSWTPLPG